MFFLFRRKKKKNVYTNLDSISFCGKIESQRNVVIKFPEDPTLFSFALPAARKIEDYFHGTKYGIFSDDAFYFVAQFLRYVKRFPQEDEKLKRFNFDNTVLIDFELKEESVGTPYPFKMRVGFKKELFPTMNIIYTTDNPEFPQYYEKVVENMTNSTYEVKIKEHKTKRGWAWEFLKYLGMTQKKKVLLIDFKEERGKLRKTIKERHSERWFVVFFDELHDVSVDQKIALLLVADSFLFDKSFYAYFATKEGIKSYKLGELPFKTSKTSSLKIVDEKDVLQIIK